MGEVNDREEIILNGKRYPLASPVQETVVTPFPQKITLGDFSRDSEVIASSIVWGQWGGGLGIVHGEYPKDVDRFDFSTLDTRYQRHLSLAPLVSSVTADSTATAFTGSATFMIDYGGAFYVAFGTKLYSTPGYNTAPTLVYTATSDIVDGAVYRGKLYLCVLGDNAQVIYDGVSFTLDASTPVIKSQRLVVWDGKLYSLNFDGSFSHFDGTTWTSEYTAAENPTEYGTPKQLLVYFDQLGSPQVHLLTSNGLYGYNTTDKVWNATPMTYPSHPKVGRACVWRGDLYIPVGSSVYKYNNQTVAVVGPDKDEGLPQDYRGVITQLVATHQFMYGIVNSAVSDDPAATSSTAFDWVWPGFVSPDVLFAPTVSKGLVLASTGISWHGLAQETEAGSSMGFAAVSDTADGYTFWYSVEGALRYLALPWGVHNPLQDPYANFTDSGFLQTPWYDASWAELDKLALSIKITASQLTTTEYLNVYAQWDNDDAWEFLGMMNSGIQKTININESDGGKVFRRVRFRVEAFRGTDTSKTPVINTFALSFMRRPPVLWGYQVNIDCTFEGDKFGRTAREMKRELQQLVMQETTFTIEYHDRHTNDRVEARVVVSRESGIGIPGGAPNGFRGRISLSLIEVQIPNG